MSAAFAHGTNVGLHVNGEPTARGSVSLVGENRVRIDLKDVPSQLRVGTRVDVVADGEEAWTGEVIAVLPSGVWLSAGVAFRERERRASHRVTVEIPVEGVAVGGSGLRWRGRTIDLSEGGALVGAPIAADRLFEGDNWLITLHLPSGPLSALSRVVRSAPGEWRGFEFLNLTPEDRDRLGEFVGSSL